LPTSPCSTIARKTKRPMRPNPLIATFTAIGFVFVKVQFQTDKAAHRIGEQETVNPQIRHFLSRCSK